MLSVAISILKGEERPAHLARDGPNAKARPGVPEGGGDQEEDDRSQPEAATREGGGRGVGREQPSCREENVEALSRAPATFDYRTGRRPQEANRRVSGGGRSQGEETKIMRAATACEEPRAEQ